MERINSKSRVVAEMLVDIKLTVTEEDIDDIMCSALEGGINYWCDIARVPEGKRVADWGHEQIARGGELQIHVIEPFAPDDTEWYTLNLGKFLEGLRAFAQDPSCSNDCLEEFGSERLLATGNIDADCADTIIQYALFGEIVYA